MTATEQHRDGQVDVAFITVNYNTRALLEEMVAFFRANRLPFSWSLTVVDNASTDGSRAFLDSCPDVQVVQNAENIGYGRAMNRGIAATASRYLCLLNTDLILNAEALNALAQHCDAHRDVAVCAPMILNRDGSIQGFFFSFDLTALYFEGIKKIRHSLLKRRLAAATEPVRLDGIAGAFIFCRRDLAPQGTLFDEDFFFYYEDTELAHRLWRQGLRCDALPRHSVVHLGGQSSSVRHIRLFYAGKYLYIRKMFGPAHGRAVLLLDTVRVLSKRFFYRALLLFSGRERLRAKLESYSHAAQVLSGIRRG